VPGGNDSILADRDAKVIHRDLPVLQVFPSHAATEGADHASLDDTAIGVGSGTAPRVLSGTGTHIVVPTRLVSEAEIIVSVMEKRLSFAGMSVSAMEMNASMKETIASVSTKVWSEVQKVRSAVEMIFSVFQRIISVSNQIISVTEIIVDGGEAAMLLIRRQTRGTGTADYADQRRAWVGPKS